MDKEKLKLIVRNLKQIVDRLTEIGLEVGLEIGLPVGESVGFLVGEYVGFRVGESVGLFDVGLVVGLLCHFPILQLSVQP